VKTFNDRIMDYRIILLTVNCKDGNNRICKIYPIIAFKDVWHKKRYSQ